MLWTPEQTNSLPIWKLTFYRHYLNNHTTQILKLKSIFSIIRDWSRNPVASKVVFFLTVVNTSNKYAVSLFGQCDGCTYLKDDVMVCARRIETLYVIANKLLCFYLGFSNSAQNLPWITLHHYFNENLLDCETLFSKNNSKWPVLVNFNTMRSSILTWNWFSKFPCGQNKISGTLCNLLPT